MALVQVPSNQEKNTFTIHKIEMIEANLIKTLSKEIREEIICIRRHIHAHPELSYQEVETANFISAKLTEWNISHEKGIGGHGIAAIIKGKNPTKKVIALRADMDALPITEKNDISFKSQNTGVMHACGHDVHSSSLLGTAKILNSLKSGFEGTVKLIFQPAEEKLPGGASLMIKAGILENPKPDVIIAQHVFTQLPVGKAGFFAGKYMASSDELYIIINGQGGHAAVPAGVINPLFLAARLLVMLEELSHDLSLAAVPTILTFGKITGAGATNIIPDEVRIEGTFRTMDEGWRQQVHERLKTLVAEFSDSCEGTVDLDIIIGYPCLTNDETITRQAINYTGQYLGRENVLQLSTWMASEDFAFYSMEIPACFYRIGTGNPSHNIISPVHTATFNIDEDALEISTGLMAWIAINLLRED